MDDQEIIELKTEPNCSDADKQCEETEFSDKSESRTDTIEEVSEEEESSGGERTVSLTYGLNEGLIHTPVDTTNVPIIQMIMDEQAKSERNPQSLIPQINVTSEDSDQVEAYDNYSDKQSISEPKYETLDPNYVDYSSKAYQMRRDSIRLSLQSSNIDLGNAIECNGVSFGYNPKTPVLTNISINVPKGKIYALLGSSGCGKTTLLRLLLGRMKPKKGKISVFGEEPGAHTSHIPGPGVGYMPQELALFTEFTMEETMQYFGALYHMDSEMIQDRIDFLIKLLNLPPKDRKVSQLSGGQQRRASIAVALFHAPPLLILDEPTVGVDPLLRCRIWEYLESLCVNESMTVLITTHYVEESRGAQTIGFMRFGRILAQTSPTKLLTRYNTDTLEDVFLKLCEEDCDELKRNDPMRISLRLGQPGHRKKSIFPTDQISPFLDPEIAAKIWVEPKYKQKSVDWKRLKALFHKNYLKLKGNPALVVFFLILPVVQITLFCESVVKQPDRLPISIFAPETIGNLTEVFLNTLDTQMLRPTYHESFDAAINQVERGKAWYAISISENFTDAFYLRATEPQDMEEEDIEDSKIKLYPDHSDQFIQQFIYHSLFETYHKFLEKVVSSVGWHAATVSQPIAVQEPIYGRIEHSLINTIAPGSIVAIIYSTPLLLASFLIVLERKDGLLERSFVSGVRSFEILVAHMCTLMLALAIQVALLMFVSFVIFEVRLLGPVQEVFWLIYLQGMIGIILGLLVSAISPNETAALLLAFGFVFPMWMVCGVFWPLHSVPGMLKTIFYAAPLSLPIESMRYIITRGWTIEYFDVQVGFAVSGAYNLFLFIGTAIIFHMNSN